MSDSPRLVTDAPLLTVGLLEELAARWRRQRAPIVEHLRPGLSGAAMDELCAPLGLIVPSEARVWWGWHDGAEFGAPGEMVGTGWSYAPLRRAVERTARERDNAYASHAGLDPEQQWPSSWLALSEDLNGGVAAVDCTEPTAAATPVYWRDHAEMAVLDPGTRTLGEMVSWWIEAMDDGVVDYNADAGRWNYHYDRLDPRRELTRLI